ncbi:hypothetical protein CA2015_4416 [Cyclobacterium amurskyense]|uniref:Uncharacterized protein n=1 Tax=Cyclobacterium amurskyense TaxID=320787 RepID=A0A0H4PL56_9BACT|nr:hypothetical protein CA2015_4416 [Cyclobacterium amurskyense]
MIGNFLMILLILMLLIKIHHYFLYRRINQIYFNDSNGDTESKNGLVSILNEISNSTSDLLLKKYIKIFVFEVYLFRFLILLFFVIVIYNLFL